MSGRAVDATTGGLAGALIGLGIPAYEAKRYEGKIKGGSALISVHTDSSEERDKVKEIFKMPMQRIFPRLGKRQFKLDGAIARNQEIIT